jgi:hypothetical protein
VYQLLADLPPERFSALYAALPEEMRLALDAPVARVLNARLPSVRRQPAALKVRALRAWMARERDDSLAGEMLRSYFLGPRKDLVVAFLDATGVKHKDGQIEGEDKPDPARVPEAVAALRKAHDAQDVQLYLRIAALQWPEDEALRAAAQQAAT